MTRISSETTYPTICDVSTINTKLSPKRISIRKNGISATATLMNFLRGMIGPGCLSLPLAFRQAGLWTAFIMVFVFGLLNNFCMLKIVHCSQYLSTVKGDIHLDYGSVAYEAFAHSFPWLQAHKYRARFFTNAMIIVLQMGVCSVFYVFIAVHLKEVVEAVHPTFILLPSTYMLILFFPLVLINFLKSLRMIAAFSLVANILMFISFAIIFQDLIRAEHFTDELPSISSFDGIVKGAGSILYAFEGQAIVLPMENGMKYPEDMLGATGVLSTGMSIVTAVYAASGFFGYITYGENVKGSITLNLPSTMSYSFVKGIFILVVYIGFVIQQYVIVDIIWPTVKKNLKKNASAKLIAISDYVFRTLLLTIAMFVALTIPRLEKIIPLVGIGSGMLLAFVIPSVLDTATFVPQMIEKRLSKWRIFARLLQNILLIVLGLFGLIAGLRPNIVAIISDN